MLFLLCKRYDGHHHKLMALESLGGHLMAFAGIIAFGNMLFSCWFEETIWTPFQNKFGVQSHVVFYKYLFVLGMVTLGLLALFYVSRKGRKREFHGAHWIKEVTEAENEAGALIFGFLVLQTSVLGVTGKPPSLHDHACGGDGLVSQALRLMSVGFLLLFVMVGVSFVKSKFQTTLQMQDKKKKMRHFNFRKGLTMAGAYCIERSAKWMAISYWNDTQIAHVLSAFAVSLFSVAAVLALTVSTRSMHNDMLEKIDNHEHQHKNEALQALFMAFAVLSGLAWDHAFEICETNIVTEFEKRPGIPSAITKMGLALFLCVIVIPGWAWYILPAARKSPKDHLEIVKMTNDQYDNLEKDGYNRLEVTGEDAAEERDSVH